jgi:tRNA (guanine37-N1)-methyltransferase
MTFGFHVVSLFPDLMEPYLSGSILGRARAAGLIDVSYTNPRDFTTDVHRTVDDSPYGGGAGLLMMPEPLGQAIDHVREAHRPAKLVLLSAAGRTFDQDVAAEFAALGSLALVCGRYEGVDQRVMDELVDEEISLGDFVITGGELGAMAVIDAVSRLLEGVVGHPDGARDESFTGVPLLEYPQYTRPRSWRGREVPEILLSGDHGKIAAWRQEQRLSRTSARRPDLFERFVTDGKRSEEENP